LLLRFPGRTILFTSAVVVVSSTVCKRRVSSRMVGMRYLVALTRTSSNTLADCVVSERGGTAAQQQNCKL
jgi:hypothetical protein